MPKPRIDHEASEAIKRIESQMSQEGKLDKAYASEGAGILFLPLLLGAVGVVGWALKSMGASGPETVVFGVAILIGLGLLGFYSFHRN